jgi:cell division septum initiation protein DivIVA
VDVNAKIDELIEIVESARAMPMSASCVINRTQVLDLLDDLKRGLPEEMDRAKKVLADRESVLADGRREAERLLERTRTERDSIIGNTDVSREARGAAERILSQARHEADQIRVEADDYVDQKLANFEVVLTKTLQAVGRGRDKMRGSSSPMEELGRHVEEQDAVQEERRRSRDFSGGEDENRFDNYETGEFTAAAFAEADRPYEQHPNGYDDQAGAYQDTGTYAAQDTYVAQDEYAAHDAYAAQSAGYPAEQVDRGYGSYEQGAYDQGAAQGYGTGEFHVDPQQQQPQYAAEQGYPEQGAYPEQYEQPQYQHPGAAVPPAQYPADETSYFDTGLIDVRQFQHDGYGR